MLSYLSLVIFFLIMVVGCVLSITRYKKPFYRYIGVMLSIMVLHLGMLLNVFNLRSFDLIDYGYCPLALLYGPLLYFSYRASEKKETDNKMLFINYAPAILFTILYAVYLYGLVVGLYWEEPIFSFYVLNYVCLSLSLIYYPISIFYMERNRRIELFAKERLIKQLSIIYLVTGFLIIIHILKLTNINTSFGFDQFIFMIGLTMITIALISRFLLLREKIVKSDQARQPADIASERSDSPARYLKSTLDEKAMEEYKEKLHSYLVESRLYLTPELSLDLLSQETEIPKHHFSQLLNTYIGKSFYQLIAEYRIEYAVKLLRENNDQFTIESLAYECGFNSKTSFNRYFKEIIGCTPSNYREIKNSDSLG